MRLGILTALVLAISPQPVLAAESRLIEVNLATINEMNFDCQAVKDVQIEIFLNGRKAGTIKDGQHLNGKPAIMYVYKPANNQLELKFIKKTAASDLPANY